MGWNTLEPYGFTDPGYGGSAYCKDEHCENDPDVGSEWCAQCKVEIIDRAYDENIIPRVLHGGLEDDDVFLETLHEKMEKEFDTLDLRMEMRDWMVDNNYEHNYEVDIAEVTITEHLTTEAQDG